VALDADEFIYVLNEGLVDIGTITVYRPLGDRTGDLDLAPVITIAGGNTGLDASPWGIAVRSRPR
jgi:hypothetical protein